MFASGFFNGDGHILVRGWQERNAIKKAREPRL